MAMLTPAEKNTLVVNRIHVLNNTVLTEELYSFLMENHSLTDSMVEEIKVIVFYFFSLLLCFLNK